MCALRRKKKAAEYAKYLEKLAELARKVKRLEWQDKYPEQVKSNGQKALYDNLDNDPELALMVDTTVKYTAKDGWRENKIKERQVMQAVKKNLPEAIEIGLVMEVVKNQNEY